MWNNDFDGAEETVLGVREQAPRLALSFATSRLMRAFLVSDVTSYEEVATEMARVATMADKFIADPRAMNGFVDAVLGGSVGDRDTVQRNCIWDASLVAADARLLRAMVLLNMESRKAQMKGMMAIRKAHRAYKVIEREVGRGEVAVDAFVERGVWFGRGLFQFVISLVPPGLLAKVLKAVGFVGDRENGLALIQSVFEAGSARCGFCGLVLLFSKLYLPTALIHNPDDLRDAETIITTMLARYPRSSMFLMFRSQLLRKQHDPAGGAEAILDAMRVLDARPLAYDAELANCYFAALDFEAAHPLLRAIGATDTDFAVRGFATLQAAACGFLLDGDLEAAQSTLAQVADRATKSRWDRGARLLAASYAQHPACMGLLAYEVLFLKRDLAHMGGEASARVVDAMAALAEAWEPEAGMAHSLRLVHGAALAQHARTTSAPASLEAATVHLEAVASLSFKSLPPEQRHCVPMARYELAQLAFEAGALPRAQALLEEARGCGSKYLWSGVVSRRVRLAQSECLSPEDAYL